MTAIESKWKTRGYLPHFHGNEKLQFISYRMSDSLPASVIQAAERHIALSPPEKRVQKKITLLENYADQGFGSCALRYKHCADAVIENGKHFECIRYDLLEWVVMPNHVHLIVKIHEPWEMEQVIHSWKSFMSAPV